MSAASTAEGAPRQSGGARRRSIARLFAVQALYQLALNPGLGTEAAIREFVRDRLGREIDGDLYGEWVRIEWVERLRDIERFDSVEQLKEQLQHDRQRALAVLAGTGSPSSRVSHA